MANSVKDQKATTHNPAAVDAAIEVTGKKANAVRL